MISMQSAQSRIDYRPDVDGLRAIAVLAVVGFHAFPRFVPGGYVGVDVFFVISGFLISGILFTQCGQGRCDLPGFYVRRIRRIVPALIVVLVAVAVVGLLVLTREDYKELQEEIAAGAFFVSNLQFWRSVALPILTPSLLGAVMLLFGNAFGAQATAYQLTGGLINLVTLLVGDQLTGDVLHTPGKGFALAVGMIVVMAIALAGYAILQRRAERWRKA